MWLRSLAPCQNSTIAGLTAYTRQPSSTWAGSSVNASAKRCASVIGCSSTSLCKPAIGAAREARGRARKFCAHSSSDELQGLATDADLPPQDRPVERQSDAVLLLDLACFRTGTFDREVPAFGIDIFQNQHSGIGPALGVDARQRSWHAARECRLPLQLPAIVQMPLVVWVASR